jgi:hypothetical protein
MPVDDVFLMGLAGIVCASFFVIGLIRAIT